MIYTFELSTQAFNTLQRVSWALAIPMSLTAEIIFEQLPELLDPLKVCSTCQDQTRCRECQFHSQNDKEV